MQFPQQPSQPLMPPESQPYQQQYQQPPPPYMMMMPPQAPPMMWPMQSSASAPVPQQQLQMMSQPTLPPPSCPDEVRTLWVGELQYWMEEPYLYACFAHTGEVASVKIIRNKQTNQSEGYGFVEFTSRAAADNALQTYNGTLMPNSEQNFRLNWATFSGSDRRDDTPSFTIFVGDLAADVTDQLLFDTFRVNYRSVKGAKVVIDRMTGFTKGYGFVRFGDESEQLRAIGEMNGVVCSTRPMRIGIAMSKRALGVQQYPTVNDQNYDNQTDIDPTNTTIFVGNLDSNVTDSHLRELFGKHGQLVHVKVPVGKRCGFVQFAERSCAEEALRSLNGVQLGGDNIRLSWGRNAANKQVSAGTPWDGSYNGQPSQGYDNFGYVGNQTDTNTYYGGYGGYGIPPQAQQVGYS